MAWARDDDNLRQPQGVAGHEDVVATLRVDYFFAHTCPSWEQGTNENTNGLLRQYFPKGTDLSIHTQEDLNQAAYSLNTRPRQTLGDMTPSEKLAQVLQ